LADRGLAESGGGPLGRDSCCGRELLVVGSVVLLGLVIFTSGLPSRQLWHPDETRFATISRTMHERGLLVPYLGDERYQDKPPMLFWLMNLSAWLGGGFTDTTVRMPAVVAAVGCLLLVYLLGRFFFDRFTGWLAAVVLATSVLFLTTGQFAITDQLLVFFQLAALYAFVRGEYARGSGTGWYAAFYVVSALATLTKGPVGLAVPAAVLAVWVVARQGLGGLRRLGLHWGIPLYLVLVAAWLVPAGLQAGWPYVEHLLMNETLWRVSGPRYSSHAPWHYYLWTYFLFAWPWALFVPEALVRAGRRWWRGRSDVERSRTHQGLLLVVIWFVVVMAGWSVAGVKRERYVLFAYPAAALAVGWMWSALLAKRERWAWTTTLATSLCIVTVLVAVVATGLAATPQMDAWVIAHTPGKSAVPGADRLATLLQWRLGFAALSGSLLVVAVGLVWSLCRRRRWVVLWLALAPLVLQAHSALWIFSMMNEFRSMRPVAQLCRQLRSRYPQATIATYNLSWTGIAWYAETADIDQKEKPKDVVALLETESPTFVLMEASRLEKLKGPLPRLGDFPHTQRKAGARRIVILSNQPETGRRPPTGGVPPGGGEATGLPEVAE